MAKRALGSGKSLPAASVVTPLGVVPLDELAVARSALERGQAVARRTLVRGVLHAHPPGGDERRDAADHAADEERPEPACAIGLHASESRVPLVICTLGDLLLDVVVRLDGPIAEDTDTYGRTRVAPGGQAANVAAWVAALGGRSRFVGVRARDAAGRMLADELTRRGVEVAGPEIDDGTGTVVSLARPDGRRTMLTDRGASPSLDRVDSDWLAGCSTLHVPAYSLVRSPIGAASLEAASLARAAGARVSVDLSGTSAIEELGVERFRRTLAGIAPDLVFANEDEARLAGELAAPVVVVKRGARGCVVRDRGEEQAYEALPAEVVDTTGAGDALAAGFLIGGVELGLEAAARCVARMGAFPP